MDRVLRWRSWFPYGFWLIACLLVCLTLGPAFLRNLNPRELTDFVQEWLSARNHFADMPVYLDQETSLYWHLEYIGRPHLKINAHPPSSILFTLPFAALPYRDAVVVWNLLSLLALVVAVVLIGRELRFPWKLWHIFPGLTLLLIYAYFGILRSQLEQAQWNLILLLLITGIWLASRSNHQILAGVLLGLATAIKFYPGLLFLSFFLFRQWRTLLTGIVTLALVTGLTVVILGGEAYRTYVVEVMPQLDHFRSARPGVSLRNFWAKLFDPATGGMLPLMYSPLLARGLTGACSLVVLGFLIRAHRGADTLEQRDRAFCLCLIAMLLVSPLAWDHYLLILLLPLAWFASRAEGKPFQLWSLVSLAIVLSVHPFCYWIPLLGDPQTHWFVKAVSPWQSLTLLSLQTYALVGLFIWGIVALPTAVSSRPATGGTP